MTGRELFYHRVGIALAVIGTLLVLAAISESVFGFPHFDNSPFIVGAGVAVVGAALASGRTRAGREAPGE